MLFGLRQSDLTAFPEHIITHASEDDFNYTADDNDGVTRAYLSLTTRTTSRKNSLTLGNASQSLFTYVILYGGGNDIITQDIATDITIGDDSTLELNIFCGGTENATTNHDINVKIGRNSTVKFSYVVLAGKAVSTKVNVDFLGEGSTFEFPSILMPYNDERFELRTVVNHNAGRCKSSQLIRSVVGGTGVSDFYGLVKVAQDAQKSETAKSNNNILLSDGARALSKPQLEIYADDVKCSHGSTTGMLDKDALFYMRSRGISEKTAQNLLLQAFVGEIVDRIGSVDYRNYLLRQLSVKMALG